MLKYVTFFLVLLLIPAVGLQYLKDWKRPPAAPVALIEKMPSAVQGPGGASVEFWRVTTDKIYCLVTIVTQLSTVTHTTTSCTHAKNSGNHKGD